MEIGCSGLETIIEKHGEGKERPRARRHLSPRRGFSPTTRYRDFAISREEFYWETQNSVSAESDTARRYADHAAHAAHAAHGWSIHLFV
jgi:hypothetical protein